MASIAARMAPGTPDISRATSKPSTIPSSAATSARSRSRGSTATVAPIRIARSRRYGFGSETTTCRAPAWRTTAVAIRPIGPAPLTRTSSPRTGKASAVWTAFPNGSKIAAISGSTPGPVMPDVRHRQDDVLGEGPVPPDPEPDRAVAQVAAAGEAVAASAAHDVAFARDQIARREVVDVAADLDDLTHELVAHDERRHDGRRPPTRPTTRCAGPCRRSRSDGPGSGRR